MAPDASRILLVDDDADLLEALDMLLRVHRPSWTVRRAGGSAQALDALAREPADVIVSDFGMPGIDGAALLERVRRVHPGVVRVLLSGHSLAELERRAAHAHVRLQKPCDTRALCAAIEQALAAHTGDGAG